VTTYRFDALNRPNAVTLAGGGTATYNWRRNSLLRQVTYPNGVTTIHNYDAANRLTDLATSQPGGITTSAFEYEYDLNGNRTVQKDENGTLTAGAARTLEEITWEASPTSPTATAPSPPDTSTTPGAS
jgi:YD repeat-containing protein